MAPSQETPAAAPAIKPEDFQIKVGARTIDCRRVLPLGLGDWRVLRPLGVDPMKLGYAARDSHLSLEPLEHLARHVLKKADPTLTDAEFDELSWMVISRLATAAMGNDGGPGAVALDTPTLSASSTSPNGGVGDQMISPA